MIEVMPDDPFGLERYLKAQATTFDTALLEIKRGLKRSHWMWFIFPQIAGLGRSHMAQRYAIVSADEARAYFAHPVLGQRLRLCVGALQDLAGVSAREVFGDVDAQKLRSSLTLFEFVSDEPLFPAALERWFFGQRDPVTLELIA